MNVVIDSSLKELPKGSSPIPNYGNYYHHMLICLGYPIDQPPVADLLRQLHGLEGEWLVASPMHWQATHNDAMVTAIGDDLALSEEEGQAWFTAFAKFTDDDMFNLYYHDANTWLIQPKQSAIDSKPIHRLLHQSMMPHIEALDITMHWQRFITEIQMFLTAHPLNKQRQCPINGVWIWGRGPLKPVDRDPAVIHIDDKRLLPLASLLSSKVVCDFDTQLQIKCQYSAGTLFLYNPLNIPALQLKLRKKTVNWYWNNHAYQTKAQHWFNQILVRRQSC